MPDTVAHLVPALTFLASTAGAGWLASALFAAARRRLPCPSAASWRQLTPLGRLVVTVLYAPRHSRLAVFVLAAAISLLATLAAALLAGHDPRPALDAALAIIVSQLVHAAGLSPQATPSERAPQWQ